VPNDPKVLPDADFKNFILGEHPEVPAIQSDSSGAPAVKQSQVTFDHPDRFLQSWGTPKNHPCLYSIVNQPAIGAPAF